MTLVGSRIVLRPYTPGDAAHTFRWKNDPETTQWMGPRFRRTFTLEDCRASLTEVIEGRVDRGLFFAIADLEGNYLGGIDLTDIDPIDRHAILSLVIAEAANRGRGYASEALQLLLGHAFETLGLHKVSLRVAEANVAAHRCYLKNGFREEGRIADLILMGIRESDFRPSKVSSGAPPN